MTLTLLPAAAPFRSAWILIKAVLAVGPTQTHTKRGCGGLTKDGSSPNQPLRAAEGGGGKGEGFHSGLNQCTA